MVYAHFKLHALFNPNLACFWIKQLHSTNLHETSPVSVSHWYMHWLSPYIRPALWQQFDCGSYPNTVFTRWQLDSELQWILCFNYKDRIMIILISYIICLVCNCNCCFIGSTVVIPEHKSTVVYVHSLLVRHYGSRASMGWCWVIGMDLFVWVLVIGKLAIKLQVINIIHYRFAPSICTVI